MPQGRGSTKPRKKKSPRADLAELDLLIELLENPETQAEALKLLGIELEEPNSNP